MALERDDWTLRCRSCARRRTFTAQYKLGIVAEYDAAPDGEKGAVLRREGLFSDHVIEWRRARNAGALAGLKALRSRKPRDKRDAEIARLNRPGFGQSLHLNGLLVSEATGANIEALGIERGHRTLVVTRKGGKVVTIPLAPRTARAIDLAIGERAEGPIFLTPDGGRLDRHGAGRIARRAARRAGITKPVGPHTLRHAFITAALDGGVPLRDVQEAASHADPRTTMRYDRARTLLDRHATYIVAAYVAGAAR